MRVEDVIVLRECQVWDTVNNIHEDAIEAVNASGCRVAFMSRLYIAFKEDIVGKHFKIEKIFLPGVFNNTALDENARRNCGEAVCSCID